MKRLAITNCCMVLFFCSVLLLLQMHGVHRRTFLPSPRLAAVPEPHDALALWDAGCVRGRILLLFDRQFNITYPGSVFPEITPEIMLVRDNYVYLATARNIVRKIYHIVPDAAWGEVEQALAGFPVLRRDGARYTMAIYDGIPLFITRLKDLPHLPEPALVHINGNYWDEKGISGIAASLRAQRVHSDLITVAGVHSEKALGEFGSYAKAPF